MLTQAQIDTLASDGYIVVSHLYAESVVWPVRQLIARYTDAQIRTLLAAVYID